MPVCRRAPTAYRRVPMSVDASALWNAGLLAALPVILSLFLLGAVSLAAEVPPGPRADPGPRVRSAKVLVALGGTFVAMAVALIVSLYLVPVSQFELEDAVFEVYPMTFATNALASWPSPRWTIATSGSAVSVVMVAAA